MILTSHKQSLAALLAVRLFKFNAVIYFRWWRRESSLSTKSYLVSINWARRRSRTRRSNSSVIAPASSPHSRCVWRENCCLTRNSEQGPFIVWCPHLRDTSFLFLSCVVIVRFLYDSLMIFIGTGQKQMRQFSFCSLIVFDELVTQWWSKCIRLDQWFISSYITPYIEIGIGKSLVLCCWMTPGLRRDIRCHEWPLFLMLASQQISHQLSHEVTCQSGDCRCPRNPPQGFWWKCMV